MNNTLLAIQILGIAGLLVSTGLILKILRERKETKTFSIHTWNGEEWVQTDYFVFHNDIQVAFEKASEVIKNETIMVKEAED